MLEAHILSGELLAGDRLPTTQQLAEQFGVTVRTVHQAATLLTRRGLLERIPGRGTFVSDRIVACTIGIVFGSNAFGDPRMLFYQRLYGLICRELKNQGWNTSLYFPSEEDAQVQMLTELEQDIHSGRLRGIIPLCSSTELGAWLEEHPEVPRDGLSHRESCSDQFVTDVCRGTVYLLERGYRRIAVVLHTATMSPAAVDAITASISQAHAERGLPMQSTVCAGQAASMDAGIAVAGRALAAEGARPDAFLVMNDMGCSGVIFELLCRRLRIPEDVAVMAYASKGIAIPCPVPLTRLERDPADFARERVEELMAALEGREPVFPMKRSQLIVGKSCGE